MTSKHNRYPTNNFNA